MLEAAEVDLVPDQEQIADLPVTGIDTELLDEAPEDRDRLQREPDLGLGSELGADAPGGFRRGAGAHGLALKHDHIAQSTLRQVVGDATADHAPSDDDGVSGPWKAHRPSSIRYSLIRGASGAPGFSSR